MLRRFVALELQPIRPWDVECRKVLRTLPQDDQLMDVTFSPDGTLLAAAGYNKDVAFSLDGVSLASGGCDSVVYLWGIPR